MSIQPEALINITRRVLNLMGEKGAMDVKLTYVFKDRGVWKVNFSYMFPLGIYKKTGSFVVDDVTEEIKGMWLDRTW